jgi:PII-like signaling protein
MSRNQNGKLLRIYVSTKDHYNGNPLYEAIVKKAQKLELAGATVIKGIEGFGACNKAIHRDNLLRLSENLPLIIEIIDTEDKICAAIDDFEEILNVAGKGSLITSEDVEIIRNK